MVLTIDDCFVHKLHSALRIIFCSCHISFSLKKLIEVSRSGNPSYLVCRYQVNHGPEKLDSMIQMIEVASHEVGLAGLVLEFFKLDNLANMVVQLPNYR